MRLSGFDLLKRATQTRQNSLIRIIIGVRGGCDEMAIAQNLVKHFKAKTTEIRRLL